MLVPEHFLPGDRYLAANRAVRREIVLPRQGSILQSQGTRVEPNDLVAEIVLPPRYHVLDAATMLGLAPAAVLRRLLVAAGDPVEEGQPLVRGRRLSRRTVRAPAEGKFLEADEGGRLLLQSQPLRQQLRAGMSGLITQVRMARSLAIEAQGSVLQGVAAHGRSGAGLLRLMTPQPDGTLLPEMLNAGLRDTLLIAGRVAHPETLEQLRPIGIGGLLVGSMDAALRPVVRQMPYPILLLEGFGTLPLCPPAWELLEQLSGRIGSLILPTDEERGGFWVDTVRSNRPLLFVQQGAMERPIPPPGPLARGDVVRLLSAPYHGVVGTVEALGGKPLVLPSGVATATCTVRLRGGESTRVPLTNLERLLL